MKYILLILALFLACFLGFIIGRLNIPTPINTMLDTTLHILQATSSPTVANNPQATSTVVVPAPQKTLAKPTAITPNLTDTQKAMLRSFGINPDTFVITQAMITCAETKLGSARMAEIKSGAKPTLLEGATLAGCYH